MSTSIQDTPFDNIAIRLSEAGMRLRGEKDDKLTHCITFVQILRVKYLQMLSVLERSLSKGEEMRRQVQGTRSITTKELLDHSLLSFEAKINYFGFIEELNRFGRIFERAYRVLLPNYLRIRFYRNKMIDHSDDYEEYLNSMGNAYTYAKNKLIIPIHMGAINVPPRSEKVYQELSDEFKKKNIDIPPFNQTMMGDDTYSEAMFLELEKIDPKLQKDSIPDSLVNALFKYSFPVPINNLESYNEQLVNWLEDFTQEYKV